MQEEKNTTMGADLLLLFVSLIWGFGFVAQRAGMEHLGPYTYNGLSSRGGAQRIDENKAIVRRIIGRNASFCRCNVAAGRPGIYHCR